MADTKIGAYEAKTKFSELIARAEKGESFIVTKNGRPVARISPSADADQFDRDRAHRAAQANRQLRQKQGPRVSEEEAQKNWQRHRADIERSWDERIDQWLKS